MSSPFDAVTTYFLAKDSNRPFLMRQAFAEDVELQMVVKTDAISFPESAKGVAAIGDILGRRFANGLTETEGSLPLGVASSRRDARRDRRRGLGRRSRPPEGDRGRP